MANQSFSIADLQNLINQTEEENKNKPSAPIRPVPMTRQSMYGDPTREQELKSDIADPFQTIEEDLQRRQAEEQGLEPQPTTAEQMRQLEQEKELRYQSARGVGAEARRLQELKSLAPAQVTPELDAEMRMLQQRIKEAPTTVTSPEGTRVAIPRPGSADDPMRMVVEKAVRDTARGFAGLYGAVRTDMTAEEGQELVAEVRDESNAVNISAEILQLASAGISGAAIVGKGLTKLAVASPKIRNTVAALVGAPAGEATVATTGTGTLTDSENGQDVLEKKFRVLAEGALFGGVLELGAWGVKTVADISIISRVLQALPSALMGSTKSAEILVGDTIGELVSVAEKAKTPEARAEAIKNLRAKIAENFELQTGVNYDDYISGRVELPEGSFEPTLGGVSGTKIIEQVEVGLGNKDALVAFSGARQRQAEAIKQGAEELKEQVVPELPSTGVQPSATQRAEELGTEAMEEVAATVRAPLQPLEAQRAELQNLVNEAGNEITERLRQQEPGFESLTSRRENTRAKNASAEDAAEVVKTTYLDARSTKNQNYETYLQDAEEITIPANTFASSLKDAFRPEEIGNLVQMVASDNRATSRTLSQIADQNSKLTSAIAKEEQLQFDALLEQLPEALRKDKQQLEILREQARANIDIEAVKADIDWQDVKLNNVEGILQSVNEVLIRTQDVAQIGGLKSLKDALEGMIGEALQDAPEVLARRNEAIQYFQDFKNIYSNSTAAPTVGQFRFGDKISDQQFAQAAEAVGALLNKAKDSKASVQFIENMRATMEPEQLAQFNGTLNEFYRSDILAQLPRPQDLLAGGTPQTAAERFSTAITNALNKNPNLEEVAPSIKAEFDAYLETLTKAKGKAQDSSVALKEIDTVLKERAKELEKTVPFKEYGSKVQDSSSVAVAEYLLTNKDAIKTFPQIWETAGKAGRVGEDGLTDAQRKIRATIGVGMTDLLTSRTSKVDLETLYQNNPAFELAFPKDSASRIVFDGLNEKLLAMQKTKQRQVSGDVVTESVGDVGQIVSEFINYLAGPISKEGRRAKILSRAFFRLAGGPEQAKKVLTDAFLDLRVADRLLREAEERARMTGVTLDNALNATTNSYILFSLGVNSVDEFNSEVATIALEEDTEEAFAR
jgi:hypothetical protein